MYACYSQWFGEGADAIVLLSIFIYILRSRSIYSMCTFTYSSVFFRVGGGGRGVTQAMVVWDTVCSAVLGML